MTIWFHWETTTDGTTYFFGYEEGNTNTGEIKVLMVKA